MLKYHKNINGFTIEIYNDAELVGHLSVHKIENKKSQAMLDIFIFEKHRSRWLFKTLALKLDELFHAVCKECDVRLIITRVNNLKAIKLLEFFQFTRYNKNYYILPI